MYLTPTKTLLVTALRATFDGDFIDERYRNINIGIEYPEERQDYPGIWVDFEPIGELEHAGIDHTEYSLSDSGSTYAHTRWRYQGYATFTVVAMTSRERDGLFDEVIRTFAFGTEHPGGRLRPLRGIEVVLRLGVGADDLWQCRSPPGDRDVGVRSRSAEPGDKGLLAVACAGIVREVGLELGLGQAGDRGAVSGGPLAEPDSAVDVAPGAVDRGLAQLAMHSSYETAGIKDTVYAILALEHYFNSNILIDDTQAEFE